MSEFPMACKIFGCTQAAKDGTSWCRFHQVTHAPAEDLHRAEILPVAGPSPEVGIAELLRKRDESKLEQALAEAKSAKERMWEIGHELDRLRAAAQRVLDSDVVQSAPFATYSEAIADLKDLLASPGSRSGAMVRVVKAAIGVYDLGLVGSDAAYDEEDKAAVEEFVAAVKEVL